MHMLSFLDANRPNSEVKVFLAFQPEQVYGIRNPQAVNLVEEMHFHLGCLMTNMAVDLATLVALWNRLFTLVLY